MTYRGATTGDIDLRGQAKAHVGDNIQDLVHFENRGSVTLYIHPHSTRTFHLPSISRLRSYLFKASSAFGFVFPPEQVKDRYAYVRGLKIYNYQREFAAILENISPGTCQWIWQHPSFCWWLDDHPGYTLLWMTGRPGMGKTSLATYMIQNLKEQLLMQKPHKPYFVLYSLCNRQENNTASAVLSVALHQLLGQDPVIAVEAKFDRLEQAAGSSNVAPDLIWQLFCDVIEEANLKRIYLIIDGLDDCDAGSHVELFRLLRTGPSNLRILITSQPLEHLRIEVSRSLANKSYYRNFDLGSEEGAINADIDSFIDKEMDRVAEVRGYSVEQKQMASHFLKKGRSGIFLTVFYVIKELEQTLVKDMETILDSTSVRLVQLDATYRKLLSAIRKENVPRCSEILKYVLYMYRPLSVAELAFILDYKSTISKEGNCSSSDDSSYKDLRNDLKLIGPIIYVKHEDDTIHFFHSSARKFLEQCPFVDDSSFTSFVVPAGMAYTQLAIFCLEYLMSHSDEEFPSSCEDLFAAKLQKIFAKHPLLEYAFDYWDFYIEKVFSEDRGVVVSPEEVRQTEPRRLRLIRCLESLADILNDSTRLNFSNYFRGYKSGKFYPWLSTATPLQLYLQLGLHSLLKDELEKYQQTLLSTSDCLKFQWYALHCAASSGSLNAFQIVLHHLKAKIDGPDWCNLVINATRTGNAELVRFILSQRGTFPREIAIAAIEAAGQTDGSVLEALGEDRLALRAKDRAGRNALHHLVIFATDRGDVRLDVVQKAIFFFKDRGIGLNEQDAFQNTILHHICWSNSLCKKSLLKALLDNKANQHLPNLCGSLPLHLASRRADFEAFDFLLSETKFDPAQDASRLQLGLSTLTTSTSMPSKGQLAYRIPDPNVTQLTVRPGPASPIPSIDLIRFQSKGGLTPLHWAMSRHCNHAYFDDIMVFRSLLIRGFSLTMPSKTGRTPLSIASDNPEILDLLCLIYYRLDGAGHMHLSLVNALGVLHEARCIDDIWTGLDFDRNFSYLLSDSERAASPNDQSTYMRRAMVVYFVLRGTVISKLLPQLTPGSEVIDEMEKPMKDGQRWDHIDHETIKYEQWQALTLFHVWQNRREDKAPGVASIEKSVGRARRRHLLRYLPTDDQASTPAPNDQRILNSRTSRQHRNDPEKQKRTIRKIESVWLAEDWKDFYRDVKFEAAAADDQNTSESSTSLRLLNETASARQFKDNEKKIEALTRLSNLFRN